MTAPTLTIDSVDQTDYIQDQSLRVTRNSADATLVDPSTVPVVGDAVAVTDPTWAGSVVGVESVTWREDGTDHRFLKILMKNTTALPDLGAASFNLSDNPNLSTTFPYRDLTVSTVLRDSTTEVRAKLTTYTPGLYAGHEVDLTSAAEGYSAETFTIMDITVDWPTDDLAVYSLDLGLGPIETAPSPTSLRDYIESVSGTGNDCCEPTQALEYVDDGDGSTTSWVTAAPYTAGSLRVYVDGVNVSPEATEDNPATGAFSLSFAPATGEAIRVSYS